MISERLKIERKRIGASQEVFAESAGVSRRAYAEWESVSSQTSPTAVQLAGLSAIGADILFIVTGNRQSHGIGESAVYQAVLDAVDLLSLDKKIDAQQLAKAVVKLCEKGVKPAKELRSPLVGEMHNYGKTQAQFINGDVIDVGGDMVKNVKNIKNKKW